MISKSTGPDHSILFYLALVNLIVIFYFWLQRDNFQFQGKIYQVVWRLFPLTALGVISSFLGIFFALGFLGLSQLGPILGSVPLTSFAFYFFFKEIYFDKTRLLTVAILFSLATNFYVFGLLIEIFK